MTVAVHEAGHAVAAFCFGIKFEYVTIIPVDLGHAHLTQAHVHGISKPPQHASDPRTKDEPESLAYWQDRLIMVLAGPVAHAKRHPHAHWLGYALGDDDEAESLINDIHPEMGRRAYYDHIKSLAVELIERRWNEIQAVAAALVERKTLTYDDVSKIIVERQDARPAITARHHRKSRDHGAVASHGGE